MLMNISLQLMFIICNQFKTQMFFISYGLGKSCWWLRGKYVPQNAELAMGKQNLPLHENFEDFRNINAFDDLP